MSKRLHNENLTVTPAPNDYELPRGVKLLRTLRGHKDWIGGVAWSPDGSFLASGGADKTVRVWKLATGYEAFRFTGHKSDVFSVAFSPNGEWLASGSRDSSVRVWDIEKGTELRQFIGHTDWVLSIAFSPDGDCLASSSRDNTVRIWDVTGGRKSRQLAGGALGIAFHPKDGWLAGGSDDGVVRAWDAASGNQLRQFSGHTGVVFGVAFSRNGQWLASASGDNTLRLWETATGKLVRTLEGHTGRVQSLAYSDSGLLASKGSDDTVGLWRADTGACVGVIPEPASRCWPPGLSFHPSLPLLAAVGSDPGTSEDQRDSVIHIWQLDLAVLLRPPTEPTISYTSAKVVLVGDTGVGKSGLGMVLAGERFQPGDSTHGRRVWRFDRNEAMLSVGQRQIREVMLWDLAGQPGYRLVHQLNIDQAALALVLVDARSETDPLGPAEYWARAIDQARSSTGMRKFLVAARIDRGGLAVNAHELRRFADRFGFAKVFHTSAKNGKGVERLAQAIRKAIRWEDLETISSTDLFTAIKEYLQREKARGDEALIAEVPALFSRCLADARKRGIGQVAEATLEAFRTCVGRLEAAGLVEVLQFSALDGAGQKREYVLLQPEYIDAYASAAVMTAREDPRGIGHLPESDVLAGKVRLPRSERIPNADQERILLAAVVERLLKHDVALRERLDDGDYLVFPSEYTRSSPYPRRNAPGVAFEFEGATRAIFTTLVVRLAHHQDFAKSDFYRDAACYRTATGGRCAVVLDEPAPGQGRMTAYFEDDPGQVETQAFLRFVRQHLEAKARPGSVHPHRVYFCRACGYGWDENLIEGRLRQGKRDIGCPECDERTQLFDLLAGDDERAREDAMEIDADAEVARRRQLATTAVDGKKRIGEYDVFLSYHSADRPQVVELAEALLRLGLRPWLDVWDLVPGRPWQEGLEAALERIDSAAVCVGPGGVGPWQSHELMAYIRKFVDRRAPVIPVLLPGVLGTPKLPTLLESFLWVDMREFTPERPRPLSNLVAGILGQRPVEMDPNRLADQVAAILSMPVNKQKATDDGKEIVLPVNHSSLTDVELEAVRQQTAQLLGVPSERLILVGTRPGSVQVVLEVKDFQAVSRLFAMVSRGDAALKEFFKRCQINHEQFQHENRVTGEQVRQAVAARQEEAELAEPVATLAAVPEGELTRWTGGVKVLTLAVVFTDIVDSTRLCNDLGDAQWERIRQQHFGRAVSLIREQNGFVVKNTGDGILAMFHGAVDAAEFALRLHKETGHAAVRIRAGVHVGQVNLDGDDAFGRNVNMAARIMNTSKADGVMTCRQAKQDIDERGEERTRNWHWTELPNMRLKGFPEAVTFWKVELSRPSLS